MVTFSRIVLCTLLLGTAGASLQEDSAADALATAFVSAHTAANLPKLEQIGRNKFREQACSAAGDKQGMRFPSGFINDAIYQTVDPSHLSEAGQKLAVSQGAGKTPARFGVGVCFLSNDPLGRPIYSVLIATYESRGTSLFRILWN
jgi:hypothetical protein